MTELIGLNVKMREVRELVDAKGFSSDRERVWEMLTLIHSEVSEAADAYKKGEPLETMGVELIDAVIRILHLVSALELDAEKLYQDKMAINWARPSKYGTVRGG